MLWKDKLSGVGTALVTPFTADNRIDYDSLAAIVEYSINAGVDFLVALGTTGEAPVLSEAEKKEVSRKIVEFAAGRVPLVIGVGGNNTLQVAQQLRKTDLSGYSYVLSVAPYYNKPSQAGLYMHYRVVAESSPLPVIIYNIPSRCGVNVEPETILKLAREVPGIAGVKEASGNVINIGRILKARPENFVVLSGDDSLTSALMAMGAEGVISTAANVLPHEMTALTRAVYNVNWDEARRISSDISDIIKMLFEQGNPAGVKAALHIKGLCQNLLRLPLVKVSDDLYGRLFTSFQGR